MNCHFKILPVILLLMSYNVSAKDYFKDKPNFIEENLKKSNYKIDTSAEAIVLYEKYEYELNGHSPVITCKIRRIIKILKKSGIHYADVDVPVYHALDHFSSVRGVSGTTYNLENGQVTEQRLNGDNIFKGTYGAHIKEKKFSMPAVREGSLIEYTFEIDQDITRVIGKWTVQGYIPKLYSELEVTAANHYEVVALTQGGQKCWEIKKDDPLNNAYKIVESDDLSTNVRWVRQNVQAICDEPFVSSINNYREELQLFIKGIAGENDKFYTWEKMNEFLYGWPKFYKAIDKSGGEVADKTNALIAGEKDELAKAKKIFAYLRGAVSMGKEDYTWIENTPADVLTNKTGTANEINILLAAMLQDADIVCSPVLLSTKDNGRTTDIFPDIDSYNYTICEATIAGKKYYLDASGKYNPFGVLPYKCYNGYARIVNKEGGSLILKPDDAREKSFYKIVTEKNSLTDYTVCISSFFGENRSMELREKWNQGSDEIKKYVNDHLKELSPEFHLKSYEVQHLQSPDSTLVLNIHAGVDWPADAKMIYFSPYFNKFFDHNLFTNPVRKYPVELPYTYNLTYYCQLQLPEGYTVDEKPAPLNMKLGENGQYIDATDYDTATRMITVNANMRLFKTNFKQEEYPWLQQFFEKMLAQQGTDIIIKKMQ